MVETLVRVLVLVGVIFLIILPTGNKLYAAIIDPEKKYNEAFESFVDQINEMKSEQETFSVLLKEKSAIIGFSKNADRWEYYGRSPGGPYMDKPIQIVNKPNNNECSQNACICICSGEFEILRIQKIEDLPTPVAVGNCKKEFLCKKLGDKDIVEKTIIHIFDKLLGMGGGEQYWRNGFLFTNVVGINGLSDYYGLNTAEQEIILRTEKKQNVIGFCNSDMLKYNKDKLNLAEGTCINKDWASKNNKK